MDKTIFLRSKYARLIVTYKILEITQMHGISSHK